MRKEIANSNRGNRKRNDKEIRIKGKTYNKIKGTHEIKK